MKQKKMLALTFSQLKQIYNQEIPEVVEIADKSSSVEEFKAGMLRFLEICRIENEAAKVLLPALRRADCLSEASFYPLDGNETGVAGQAQP